MRDLAIMVTSAGRRVELIQCFRSSAEELGLNLKVIACDMHPELSAACHYADSVNAVPACDDPDYADTLLEIVRRHDIALVVPTIDPELHPLSAAQSRFAKLGARVHVSPLCVIDVARDKLKTAQTLAAHGVPVPQTVACEEAHGASVPWPALLKPTAGSASRGIKVIHDLADMPSEHVEPMVLQQLLQGPEYTVNVFVDRRGELRSVVPHRRLRVRGGEVEKGRTERDDVFDRLANGVVRALPEARGAFCFQLILDKTLGPRVFEINARFGGGYPLAHHAGATFTQWLIEEVAELPPTANDGWRSGVTMLRYDMAVFQG